MRRMIMAAAAATLGLGTLVGCGGSEGSGNAQGGSDQSQPSGQDNKQGNSGNGDNTKGDTEGDSGQASRGNDSDSGQNDQDTQSSGNVSEYCEAAKEMTTTIENSTPEEDQERARSALEDIVDNAPADIQKEWNTYLEAWDELSGISEAMKDGSSGGNPKKAEKIAKSAQSKMESVSGPIEKHLKSNCGEG